MRPCTIRLALALTTTATFARPALAQTPPQILITLPAMPGVSTVMTEESREQLEEVFARAGIGIEWRDCRPPDWKARGCGERPRANEAIVRLLSGPSSGSAHTCGVALVPAQEAAHYVTLFVDCIREAADALGLREDVVMSRTLAHEIGHLFLGPDHGQLGLMQTRARPIDWKLADGGGLTFTSNEAQRLRQALIDRTHPRPQPR